MYNIEKAFNVREDIFKILGIISKLFSVPPYQLLIYDSSGVVVGNTAGPLQVGVEFGLSCEVRGGNSFLFDYLVLKVLNLLKINSNSFSKHRQTDTGG